MLRLALLYATNLLHDYWQWRAVVVLIVAWEIVRASRKAMEVPVPAPAPLSERASALARRQRLVLRGSMADPYAPESPAP